MNKKIGKLQETYLTFLSDIQKVFWEMQFFLEKDDMDMLFEYRNIIVEFGKMLPNILTVFGYGKRMQENMEAVNVYACYQTKDDMLAGKEQCDRALNELTDLVDMLLEKTHGKLKTCNCCGEHVYYMPLSDYYAVQNEKYSVEKHIPETLNREEYTCPSCFSSDRDRLMVAFLKELELNELVCAEKLLQIAPSAAIEHWIYANCPALIYDSTDFYMEQVSFKSDIQNMSTVQDESYDYFICSHVLEHVKDDRKAMEELYRILKNDGIGLFLVPIALDVEHIDEEWGLSEEENWRRFGQGDHCRTYARQEMIERLQEVGFIVHPLGKDFFGEDVFEECGLTNTSTLYALTKQNSDLQDIILERKQNRNMTWEEPFVSVILPAYNHEKYVANAIESVLNQNYHNYEFLVGDDSSDDGTVNEILKYEEQIDQIHLFDVNTKRMGNFLLEEARGKYVAMMHSDDLWASEKLRMQVIYMENHPECGACFTGCTLIDDEGEELELELFPAMNKKKEEWFFRLYQSGNCLAHPSVLIRREIYVEIANGNGPKRFRQLPDYWMWLNLVQRSEIHIIERTLTFFRWHTSGDNKNTSAPTLENGLRHMVEQSYIKYETIKNLDAAYFLKAFQAYIKKKDILDETEILCEKFFVLLNTCHSYDKQAAIHYFYEIYTLEGIPELLKTQYGFGFEDIFKITGEYLPRVIGEICTRTD